jgi:hypothetical protein
MSSYKLFDTTTEQEEELMCILLKSSLYQDKAPEDKQKMLNYLVASYFNILSSKYSWALPSAIRCRPTI